MSVALLSRRSARLHRRASEFKRFPWKLITGTEPAQALANSSIGVKNASMGAAGALMPPMLVLEDWIDSYPESHERLSSDAGPEPGTLIGGTYRVVRALATGSMGVVLLAHDETLDRDVAVKFTRSHLLSEGFRERFLTEARAMARVNHPNVVQIHAFGLHNEAPYFVMEYVSGPTLEQWLSKSNGLPDLDLALSILDKICEGVAAIHAADAVHHDIKPSNVLLDGRLRPRIADLGLAAFYRQDRAALHREIVGTPAYMAPEIAFSKGIETELRARADVYSLGCLAYQLLTGRLPFEGTGNIGTLLRHAMATPQTPSNLRADLSPVFDDAVLRAMAKDPRERTSSVEAFQRAITAARQGECEPVRILVAEDDADFREALKLFLAVQFPNAEIECVSDGLGALEAVERRPASIAIIDLRMPEIDGLELTKQLRARSSSATTPIIVITACGGPEEWKRLSTLGADRFLVKPVVLDDLAVLIRRVISERHSSASRRVEA
jgi:serine/threonine protein kinase